MLLFISVYGNKYAFRFFVSIHLMLLFIMTRYCIKGVAIEFQYISCYSLSESCHKHDSYICVSIHLMLLFIFRWLDFIRLLIAVSIHLMLLFIVNSPLRILTIIFVSIHLMLLFISGSLSDVIRAYRFQYISCYSLSQWTVK